MSELSINIHIAGRNYPLTVQAGDEAALRMAGKRIQEKLNDYADQFSLRDQQDALAMFALETANELQHLKSKLSSLESMHAKELEQIEKLLDKVKL